MSNLLWLKFYYVKWTTLIFFKAIFDNEWVILIIVLCVYFFCTDLPPCTSSPCENGGVCFQSVETAEYFCICMPGWRGVNCELPIDLCTPDACENGATCNNFQTSYSCTCPPGFSGMNCEIGKNDDDEISLGQHVTLPYSPDSSMTLGILTELCVQRLTNFIVIR